MEATPPGHKAMVCEALASIGDMPTKSIAGKPIKPPPPATELSAPATNPATKRKIAWLRAILKIMQSLEVAGSRCGNPSARSELSPFAQPLFIQQGYNAKTPLRLSIA